MASFSSSSKKTKIFFLCAKKKKQKRERHNRERKKSQLFNVSLEKERVERKERIPYYTQKKDLFFFWKK